MNSGKPAKERGDTGPLLINGNCLVSGVKELAGFPNDRYNSIALLSGIISFNIRKSLPRDNPNPKEYDFQLLQDVSINTGQ